MAEAIMGPLLGKLQELALNEANALVQVKDDIRRLRDKLMWLQAFLMEADPVRRLEGSELMRVLVSQTRAVALDAEDAIDRYYVLADPIRSRRGWRRFFNSKLLEGFAQQFLVRHHLSGEIAVMNERIEEIIKSNGKYKLDGAGAKSDGAAEPAAAEVSWSNWTLSPATPGTIAVDVSRPWWMDGMEDNQCDLVGRAPEKIQLRCFLEDKMTYMLFMVGGSGVGKTTLVRDAYQDAAIGGNFPVRIWISFPPGTRDTTIGSKIRQKLADEWSATDQQSSEAVFIDGRWCHRLVVVDCNDVRFTGQISLKDWLPNGGRGDKIVLISPRIPIALAETKLVDVHGEDRMNYLYGGATGLDHLRENDIGVLFYHKLLGVVRLNIAKDGGSINDDLVSKVYDVTKGLPRAVVMLAHLLRNSEKGQWGRVFHHICKSEKVAERLERILSLGFNALPHDLKSCFLYLAGFPESTSIDVPQLVRLWVAEGLLSPKDGKRMESIGHRYLEELVARGLVQVVAKDARGNAQSVAVLDYIQAFLRLEARESGFLEVHYGYYAPDATTVRRLSLQNNKTKSSALNGRLPNLRSVMSYFQEDEEDDPVQVLVQEHPSQPESEQKVFRETPELKLGDVLQGSKYIRVINLEDFDVGERLADSIFDRVQLRYLGVRSKNLVKIPSSIGNLSKLQTLDVRGTGIRALPDAFWTIDTLRHVLGDELRFPAPKCPGDLKHLETLETMSLEEDNGWDGKVMMKMLNLHVLRVVGLKASHDMSALYRLIYLERLTLSGEAINLDFAGLHSDNLSSIELEGKLLLNKNIDWWKIPNLSELVLKSTHVQQGFIDSIAQLLKLDSLSLLNDSFQEEALQFPESGFQNLKFLKVAHLDKSVNKIVVESDLMMLKTFELTAFSGSIEANDPDALKKKTDKKNHSLFLEKKKSSIVRSSKCQEMPVRTGPLGDVVQELSHLDDRSQLNKQFQIIYARVIFISLSATLGLRCSVCRVSQGQVVPCCSTLLCEFVCGVI